MIKVSVCLSSDALSQHLLSYLGFSYLGRGVSLHDCFSKAQPLLLTLDKVAPRDSECGIVPVGHPSPVQPPLLDMGLLLSGAAPDLGREVAPLSHHPTR